MLISGKKIIKLTEAEKAILHSAEEVLSELSDTLGNVEFFDFEDLADTLCAVRTNGDYVIDFEDFER